LNQFKSTLFQGEIVIKNLYWKPRLVIMMQQFNNLFQLWT